MADRADLIKLRNANDTVINPATEDKQDEIIAVLQGGGLAGSDGNGTVALASANTWYAVPPSGVPTDDYILAVNRENADGTIRWGFDNATTPSATNGLKVTTPVVVRLAANQVLYFGSDNAGDDVNYTFKEIV